MTGKTVVFSSTIASSVVFSTCDASLSFLCDFKESVDAVLFRAALTSAILIGAKILRCLWLGKGFIDFGLSFKFNRV